MIIKVKAIQPFDGIMVAAWLDTLDDAKRAYIETHATTSVKVKVGGKFRIYKCVVTEVVHQEFKTKVSVSPDGVRTYSLVKAGEKVSKVLALKRPFQVLQRKGTWLGQRPSWWP